MDALSLKKKWDSKFGESHPQALKSVASSESVIECPPNHEFLNADIPVNNSVINNEDNGDCMDPSLHETVPVAGNLNPELFVGNIRIRPANSMFHDTIAEAFHQSSRKELNYIPPTLQNGEIIVRPSPTVVETGSKRWNTTAVGYFLGKKPYFHHLESFAKKAWASLIRVNATVNGFFFFQFRTTADMEEVIEGGPWLFQGQPIVLQRWEPGMSLQKQKHAQIPVWIRLKHLPMEYWTNEGKEVPVRVDIEYEWLPQRCKECQSLGHTVAYCPENKKKSTKKPVEIYIQKSRSMAEVEKRDEVDQNKKNELAEGLSFTNIDQSFSNQGMASDNRKTGNPRMART
ncbi:UNVERIFIED_CONTAM: hypothetical protein Scaly_2925400 [Sesamum calycinum]|uniref:DUF4283 domain-containing protein n=1 Tax=Sesamum calycinum TaxID=2727403 RepID=A0AAW2KV28_9LAMI